MFEDNRRNRVIATTVVCAIGLSALTSCSKPKKVELTGCTTTFVNYKDTPDIHNTILAAMDEDSVEKTGKPLSDYDLVNTYKGVTDTSDAIENIYIKHLAKLGKIVSHDAYEIAQDKPFNNSVLQYCIGLDATGNPTVPGKITVGNEACVFTYQEYVEKAKSNQLENLKSQCGNLLPLNQPK